jgi:hypothetical protein
MHATLGLFKLLTNLILGKFEELAQLMVPTIISHARSIGEPHHIIGRLSKLALKLRLFDFILFMKHEYVTIYDVVMWNWSKNAINDGGIFIAFCINFSIANEIHWLIVEC